MQGLTGGEECLAMDTSAEEYHSREIDSSGEEQEQNDVTEAHEEDLGFLKRVTTIDPEPYRCSSPFYSFTSASHKLMVSSIMSCRYATAAEIVEADSSFVESTGRDKARRVAGIEGRWKVFQDRLHAQVDSCGNEQLFFKTTPDKLIAHMGQWQEIVHTFHVDERNRHFGVCGTIDRTRQAWITDTRRHGIPENFVQSYIALCPVCNPREKGTSSPPISEGKRTRPPKFSFPVQLEVPVKALPQKLEALAIEHKVVLRVLHSKRIALSPFLSEVVSYICHRGQFKRLREKKDKSIFEKRTYRASFRCGCNFRIKTLIPITNYCSEAGSYDYQTEGAAIVLLNPVHIGHDPGSDADLLHLPVHPSAIRECEEDRNAMKDIQAITRSSLRNSRLLKAQASELEQATFRFFLTKKETQRLPHYRKSKEKLLKDMAGDVHSIHDETDTRMKVDPPQRGTTDFKDILSPTDGVQDSCSPMLARRLGTQKVLARLIDPKHASSMIDELRSDHRETEASIYYSRHKQVHSGRHSVRRNQSTQMRWITESEYPERYSRDSSRLDFVNKGISQFNRLQLSEEMEADDVAEKPVQETGYSMSNTLDRFEDVNRQAGDSSFDEAGCATSNLKCLREPLKFSMSTHHTDSLGPNKRSCFGRQVRIHYMSAQPSDTSGSTRVGGVFMHGEVGGLASVSPAQVLTPYSARTKKNVGRKRKRNSLFVHNFPPDRSLNTGLTFLFLKG